jgi:putative Mn2+ efflux pump MntP
LALSCNLDNIAIGISYGIFLIGIGFGKNFGQRRLGQWAGTVAGCLLIILGVMEIFLD